MGITCLHGPPHARFMYWHQSTMARVLKRWQFSHPSTSDLDQRQGRIYKPDCLGRAATNSAEGYRQWSASWAFQNASCPLLAQNGHASSSAECPLSGVKQT